MNMKRTKSVFTACLKPAAKKRGYLFILLCGFLLGSISWVPLASADDAEPASVEAPAARSAMIEKPLAVVNGRPILAAELDAFATASGMSREDALEELIDLQLLRSAAAANGIKAPAGAWSALERIGIERALAKALSLELPQPPVMLVVDHAWLKDAEDEKGRIEGRELMVKLRTLAEGGASIPDAYTQLQVDGSAWHIGNQEEYSYDVLPAEARDLPPGSLSQIIPGDGGLHLFRVFQRKQDPVASEIVTSIVRVNLRVDGTIERPEDQTH